jgi:hypothetical protein
MQIGNDGIWLECNLMQNWREDEHFIWMSWFSLQPCNWVLSYSFNFCDEDAVTQAFV